jgi:hypothetical protein
LVETTVSGPCEPISRVCQPFTFSASNCRSAMPLTTSRWSALTGHFYLWSVSVQHREVGGVSWHQISGEALRSPRCLGSTRHATVVEATQLLPSDKENFMRNRSHDILADVRVHVGRIAHVSLRPLSATMACCGFRCCCRSAFSRGGRELGRIVPVAG